MNYQKPRQIQPLPNPYHSSSATVTTATKSQLFLLNDRSKVILDDQSDEEEVKVQLENEPTLKKKQLTYKQQSSYKKPQSVMSTNVKERHDRQESQNQQFSIDEVQFNVFGLGMSPVIKKNVHEKPKPSLSQGILKRQQSRQTIIDQIREETFVESRAVEEESFQRSSKKKRKKIFDSQAKRELARKREQILVFQSSQDRKRTQVKGCPHIECVIKSLNIIDKLTDKDKNFIRQKSNIEKIILEINIEVDALHNLCLEEAISEDAKIKFKWADMAIQQLIARIKEEPFVDSELRTEIQNACQKVHYFQMVKERYTMWKIRLQKLAQFVKQMLLLKREKRLQQLQAIERHIEQLERGKIRSEKKYCLVEQFNSYIEKERALLVEACGWVKKSKF